MNSTMNNTNHDITLLGGLKNVAVGCKKNFFKIDSQNLVYYDCITDQKGGLREMIANDSLGDKIRAWRQKKGLTQQKLSLQAGLETPHYSRIERDLHSPTIDTLDKIAAALEITTVELIQGPPKGGEDE